MTHSGALAGKGSNMLALVQDLVKNVVMLL